MYSTYPQNNTYTPQYDGYQSYAPMQQPMPVAAPAASSSSANMGLLMIAGLAVVGAAAFGGVYLMNSSRDVQPANTTAAAPSTVVNLPSEINIPGLTTKSDPASPTVVNNPAPIRVFTPAPVNQAPVSQGIAPAQVPAPVHCSTSAQVPSSGPATDPKKDDAKTGTDATKPDDKNGDGKDDQSGADTRGKQGTDGNNPNIVQNDDCTPFCGGFVGNK